MQARILNSAEEHLWSEFIQNHPLGNIHQTPEWGHFQAKIPGRGKYWIVILEESKSHSRERTVNLQTLSRDQAPSEDQTPPGDQTPSHQILAGTPQTQPHGQAPSHQILAGTPQTQPHGQAPSHQILAGTIIVRHCLPGGRCWLYASRGPLLDYNSAADYQSARAQMAVLLEEIKKIAIREKAVFLRIDPPLTSPSLASQPLASPSLTSPLLTSPLFTSPLFTSPLRFAGFRQTSWDFQPRHTLLLDLSLSEDALLSGMKPKGRYNIRLAAKKGVKISRFTEAFGSAAHASDPSPVSGPSHASGPVLASGPASVSSFASAYGPATVFGHSPASDFAHASGPALSSAKARAMGAFYRILTETASRDGFHGHDENYYREMLANLGSSATLYLASFNGEILAGSLNVYFNGTATYYYGASSGLHRELMAPYLLHWEAIRDARRRGCKFYDFFGISPEGAKNHHWQTVTDFKKKFGGVEVSYQPAQEYSFSPLLHFAYRLYKKSR